MGTPKLRYLPTAVQQLKLLPYSRGDVTSFLRPRVDKKPYFVGHKANK